MKGKRGCGAGETGELVRRSVVGLLESKKLSDLTVAEVARRALISRSTFYDYYPSVYAVYESLVEEFLDGLEASADHGASPMCGGLSCCVSGGGFLTARGCEMRGVLSPLWRILNTLLRLCTSCSGAGR